MVALALLGVVMLVVVQLLTPGLRIWNLTQARGEAEARAMLLQRRLAAELAASCSDSLYVLDEPGLYAITFLSVAREASFDPNSGVPVWREVVAWYRQGQRLTRETWKPTVPPVLPHALPTAQPFALTPAEVRLLCGVPGGQEQSLGAGVRTLSLVPHDSKSWDLVLELEASTQKGQQVVRREHRVILYNGGSL